jgi:hypothetical protein
VGLVRLGDRAEGEKSVSVMQMKKGRKGGRANGISLIFLYIAG